jgi:hypothetical protein
MLAEKRGTIDVEAETVAEELVDDAHGVVVVKSDQSQSLTKRLLVSVE